MAFSPAFGLFSDIEFFHPRIESRTIHPRFFCGAGYVPFVLFEKMKNIFALQLLPGVPVKKTARRRSVLLSRPFLLVRPLFQRAVRIRGYGEKVVGEVFPRYQVSRGDNDDVLNKILKLANVSGPFVFKEKIERIFRKRLAGGPEPERLTCSESGRGAGVCPPAFRAKREHAAAKRSTGRTGPPGSFPWRFHFAGPGW